MRGYVATIFWLRKSAAIQFRNYYLAILTIELLKSMMISV